MKCHPNKSRRHLGAIRPLDVAAIVCVLAVLSVLLVALAGRVKRDAARTRCQANLLQIGTALQLYAQDNKGLLPDCSPTNPRFTGAQWPWDISTNLTDVLATKGVQRATFYCPANPDMNDERHWNFWRNVPGAGRVIGYPMLLKGVVQMPEELARVSLAGGGQLPPASAELSFDATAGMNGDYTSIKGLWTDRSNHVKNKLPLGGNVLFLDQHVAWRDFNAMHQQFRTIGPGGWVQWSF